MRNTLRAHTERGLEGRPLLSIGLWHARGEWELPA